MLLRGPDGPLRFTNRSPPSVDPRNYGTAKTSGSPGRPSHLGRDIHARDLVSVALNVFATESEGAALEFSAAPPVSRYLPRPAPFLVGSTEM